MSKPRKEMAMGLEALFSENDTGGLQSRTLRLTEIIPNKSQPRQNFDNDAIETLADSIRQHGVLQPILVRPRGDGRYQIVAGERRWRASRLAGLEEIPVYVRELTDSQAAQLALVENLQREDLNPVEEALAYKQLIDESGITQDELAKVVGKSRSAVTNSLRLLTLDWHTMEYLKSGEISPGHARALLSVDTDERQALIERIKRESLSVRQLEKIVQPKPGKKPQKKDKNTREFELSMFNIAGRACKINKNRKGEGGTITIEYFDEKDLNDIAKLITDMPVL